MNILHVVPDRNASNGMFRVASLMTEESVRRGDLAAVLTVGEFWRLPKIELPGTDLVPDEVCVHGLWLPSEWLAMRRVLKARMKLVRMPHGGLSPIYLKRKSKWRKLLVSPIERFFLRRAAKVVVTCAAEERWVRAYEPRVREVEVMELKRFFDVDAASRRVIDGEDSFSERRGETPRLQWGSPLRVLYLGRRHPLKGLNYLEHAVSVLNRPPLSTSTSSLHLKPSPPPSTSSLHLSLRIVSDHVGDELERDWDWCDVLVLPTLSENFGLVVAEALERGKRVIVTDGAPAWEPPNGADTDYGGRLRYIRGFVAADDETRVRLLAAAMKDLMEQEK